MSPEQAFALNVDHRTDIYALGVVLFWLVSGRLPFEGDIQAQRDARQKPVPRLPQKTPAGDPVPERLASLVADCLAPVPTARPPNMRAVIQRTRRPLEATARGRAPAASAAEAAVGAAILASVALVGAGGWLLAKQTAVASAAPSEVPPSPPPLAAAPPALAPVPAAAAPSVPTPPATPPPAHPALAVAHPATPAPRAKPAPGAHPSHHRSPGRASPAAPPPDAFAPLPDR